MSYLNELMEGVQANAYRFRGRGRARTVQVPYELLVKAMHQAQVGEYQWGVLMIRDPYTVRIVPTEQTAREFRDAWSAHSGKNYTVVRRRTGDWEEVPTWQEAPPEGSGS